MFIVDDNPTFTHTVEAQVPVDGGFERQPFTVTYRVIDPADADQFDLNTLEGSTAFLRAVIASLGDITDPDKKPIPYSDGLRDRLLKLPYARMAISRGYFDAIRKAAEGN